MAVGEFWTDCNYDEAGKLVYDQDSHRQARFWTPSSMQRTNSLWTPDSAPDCRRGGCNGTDRRICCPVT